MLSSVDILLTDLSSVGDARRSGSRLAADLGFNEVKAGELGILITEVARNAVVHGGGGQLIISGCKSERGDIRIDVLALDRGKGIKDISRAFEDGYSTSTTPGTGLGAVRRMAAVFDLFSSAQGTVIFARVEQPAAGESKAGKKAALEVVGVVVPLAGERVSGDGVAWEQKPGRTVILAVDGLGHGRFAAEAAEEAKRIFHQYLAHTPGEIISRIHDALKKTRGAAASIAEIHPAAGTLIYAGVGNISSVVVTDGASRSLVSHNGTLGHMFPRIQEFKVEWPRNSVLIMHSDGMQSRWDLSRYPGLLARQPALIAGILFRDFRRQRDDSSVVVVKANS
jgi:anti-sigma regulatory factor (Ser/Thr protein kinase)